MAETIENNVRKVIVQSNPINPKYYENMSILLDELIQQRRQQAIDYQAYLEKIVELARKVKNGGNNQDYPDEVKTAAQRAFYDNFGQDRAFSLLVDKTIRENKEADWKDNRLKERKLGGKLNQILQETAPNQYEQTIIARIMDIAKEQAEYD
jgi:type I restriction enzyme R subunit